MQTRWLFTPVLHGALGAKGSANGVGGVDVTNIIYRIYAATRALGRLRA